MQDIERKLQSVRLDGRSGIDDYMFIEDLLTDPKKRIEALAENQE